jgi:putative ABC transport system permease protein
MENLLHDLRYGVRMLLKSPGLTASAVIALALGIGANSTIFSVVNAVLLRPLPYAEPDRLVKVIGSKALSPKSHAGAAFWSYPRYEIARDNNQTFSSIAAYTEFQVNVTGAGEPERLKAEMVSGTYFSLLGIEPIAGSAFGPEVDTPSAANKQAVLSEAYWQRRFGGDPETLGQTITLEKQQFTVVGVLPSGFRGQGGTVDIWVPITTAPVFRYRRILTNPLNFWFEVVARLKPGINAAQGNEQMEGLTAQIESVYPSPKNEGSEAPFGPGISLVTWKDANVDPGISRAFLILLAAVGFVLLIACANVANLLLSRAVARERELAIRMAVGASRRRIVRQLLTESMLLAVIGGALGLLIAMWGVDLLTRFRPSDDAQFWATYTRTFDFFQIKLDKDVLAFNLILTLLTGIIFGSIPAIQCSRPDVNDALKEGSASVTERRLFGPLSARNLLAAAQVAMSLVLLVGAGVMIKSLLRLQKIDLGFAARNVVTMRLPSREADSQFYSQVLERVKALPGVESASVGTSAPLMGYTSMTIAEHENQSISRAAPDQAVAFHSVSPDYFATLGINIVRGRGLTEQDRIGAPRVALINRTAADRLFAGDDPIGKRIKLYVEAEYPNAGDYIEIVGIVDDVKYARIEEPSKSEVYLSNLQPTEAPSTLIIRSNGEAGPLASAVRREASSVNPNVPIARVVTMQERLAEVTSRTRFLGYVLGLFAGVAVLLAAIGVYGVMAYAVSSRTREMGIRMALGAQAGQVFVLVMKEGALLVVLGLIGGLVGALIITRVLTSQLYEVSATDPLTLAGVGILLTVVAFLACYVPARRATRVDPMTALRYE